MAERTLKIPDGIEAKLTGMTLSVKGAKGELKREFAHNIVRMEVKNGEIRMFCESDRKRQRAVVGTWEAHVKNMFKGASKGWHAQLKLVYSHFPVKMSVSGEKFTVSNFLGEKKDRVTHVYPGVKVEIKKEFLELTGINKESVGQTAANIEQACKIRKKDRRVFSDGIWITKKPYMEGEDG